MKIRFHNVGRGHWNGEVETPNTDNVDTIAEVAYRRVRVNG
jgi:hypothetical protein